MSFFIRGKRFTRRKFKKMMKFIDERASEEFTSLPSIAIVMFGFAVFFSILSASYFSYMERVKMVNEYNEANYILEKITSADSPLMRSGGLIDYNSLSSLPALGIKYGIKISVGGEEKEIMPRDIKGNTVSASKKIGIYINEAKTLMGEITVVVWV